MNRKPKKCKGMNRAKDFNGCGEMTENRKYGLCPRCLGKWAFTTEQGKEWRDSQLIPSAKKKAKQREKEKTRKEREAMKSIARLIQEARVPFQKWIRFRDANEPCISCGTKQSAEWHAGHFRKAELYTGLIFEEMNVSKQCHRCNVWLSGNEAEYRKGLVKKYGEEKVRLLEAAADELRSYKFSREEIKDIKRRYQNKLKGIK